MKVMLVGRHSQDVGDGIEVVTQKNVMFPSTAYETWDVVHGLCKEAEEAGLDAIIFQMCPPQLAVALSSSALMSEKVEIGFVISKPGSRPTAETRTFKYVSEEGFHADIAGAVKFANPRAKISTGHEFITVEVEAPMAFEFSHIEWIEM